MLVEPLDLKLPLGAFNGSLIVDPAFNVLQKDVIPAAATRTAIDSLSACGVDIWLFTADRWLITRDDGRYVPHERHTILTDPVVVSSFDDVMNNVCKIVGVSAEPEKLIRCEAATRTALGDRASAARSQSYYLDITPAGRDKGTFVATMAARLGISPQAIATIGDMSNDLAMFSKSGLSFAMGNATDEVKARATHATDTNDNDGFAKAIDRILALNRP
jgi:Cof subfamily protein (haloacid dehalogenase superfamily)